MFPEPRIDLKKDQEKSLFLRLCKFLDAHRLILMIPQLQIKFRTFLNQSKTLAAGYSLNKTKQTNKQQTSSAQAERRGPHRYDLGVRSTLPSTGNEQLHQTRKQTTQRNTFFPFFI